MAATKRNVDGQVLAKQPQAPGMDVDYLLNPIASHCSVHLQTKPKAIRKKSTNQTKGRRGDRKNVI